MVQIVKDERSGNVTAITALDINGQPITLADFGERAMQVTKIKPFEKGSLVLAMKNSQWTFPGSVPKFHLVDTPQEIVSAFEEAGFTPPTVGYRYF